MIRKSRGVTLFRATMFSIHVDVPYNRTVGPSLSEIFCRIVYPVGKKEAPVLFTHKKSHKACPVVSIPP